MRATSTEVGKNVSREYARRHASEIHTVLDLGAGQGTYHDLLADELNAHWVAVEVFRPYVEAFDLCCKYDEVHSEDLVGFLRRDSRAFDLIIAGDVLEHLGRADALDVAECCYRRAQFMIVSMPVVAKRPAPMQGAKDGNPHQRHRYAWLFGEFQAECAQRGMTWREHHRRPFGNREHIAVFLK